MIGASDKPGDYPADNPMRPANFVATIYYLLGIDPATEFHDQQNGPFTLAKASPVPLQFSQLPHHRELVKRLAFANQRYCASLALAKQTPKGSIDGPFPKLACFVWARQALAHRESVWPETIDWTATWLPVQRSCPKLLIADSKTIHELS